MKKFHRSQFVPVFVLALMSFFACSKDSDSPVDPNNITNSTATITLNGAGYTNKSVTLSNGLAEYSIPDTMTALQFSGKVDNDTLYFAILVKGNNTGTYNWDDENGTVIYRITSTGNYTYVGVTQGSTTISSYGGVTGKIEGTVNGKLIEVSSLNELNISGSFSAVRLPDAN
jgi:hypothetical protein